MVLNDDDDKQLRIFVLLAGILSLFGCISYGLLAFYTRLQDRLQRQRVEFLATRARIQLQERQRQQDEEDDNDDRLDDDDDDMWENDPFDAKALRLERILNSLQFETQTANLTTTAHGSDEQEGPRTTTTTTTAMSLLEQLFTSSKSENQEEENEEEKEKAQEEEEETSEWSCCICLESCRNGQVLCCSKNTNECQHIFHEVCAFEWLLEHSECPLCRVTLIPPNKEEEEEGDDDGNGNEEIA